MNWKPRALAFTASALMVVAALAGPSEQSAQAVEHGAQVSGHASGSAAHSIAASGQVTSAVAAVPLASGGAALVSGASGTASMAAAGTLADIALQPIGTPLPVADEALTVVPPNQALEQKRSTP